uniref:ABC transporter domain-containing protein n=1 Tax=Eucampia antarctica TaxID=49252 RepID=A0A7S2VZ86_9STRA|mmetsp:Transcript_12734/g.12342  ORF Transcript_12734/g.12342 Transcript_12734/m.12342 type:complete len:648 (+) Transcript_12734:76-2019(+)
MSTIGSNDDIESQEKPFGSESEFVNAGLDKEKMPPKLGSVLVGGDDPFLPREGKALTWTSLNMSVAGKKGKEDKILLNNLWGEAPKQEITAIMGPSGSGKTSLLNILAGRLQTTGSLTVTSDIRLNNFKVDPSNMKVRKQIAFVAQDDSLASTSTPRECLMFSAKLRLPRATLERQLIVLTDRLLEELGLSHCADTYVGGPLLKGISGGERKRTSVGVELVVRPALVFLDEPTSGLDSHSAKQIVKLLKKVASVGTGVLFTIHQPSSELFSSFDHLILLSNGRVMYQGSVGGVNDFFGERGQPVPNHYNPSDWIMSVAQENSEKELELKRFFPQDERTLSKALTKEKSSRDVDEMGISTHVDGVAKVDMRKASMITQTLLLYEREFLQIKRDVPATGARFGITIFVNLLVGLIFKDVGKSDPATQSNLQSQVGAIVMIILNLMFGTAQPALLSFPTDRPVFLREYTTNHYSVISYFLARFTTEAIVTFLQTIIGIMITYFLLGLKANFFLFIAICYSLAMSSTASAIFLGCGVKDPNLANQLMPLLFVPQMLFAGFFVSTDLLPVYIRWAQYLCPLTYALRLVLHAEFDDCSKGGGEAAENCKDLLENMKIKEDDIWWYWVAMLSCFVVYRLGALFLLKRLSNKFYN